MRHHILTTGISLLTNFQKTKSTANLDEACRRHQELAIFLAENPERVSAEINSLHSRTGFLNTQKCDDLRVTLIYTETDPGKSVASLLENFLKPRLVGVAKIPVRGIDKPEGDFTPEFAQQEVQDALGKLRESVKSHIEKSKKSDAHVEIELNCTGGYKAETAVLYALGKELGVPVYYMHETFRCAVTLP